MKMLTVFIVLVCVTQYSLGWGFYEHTDGYSDLRMAIESDMQKSSLTSEALWFQQKLDHFNENDKRTWRMRYFQSEEYWKPNGPVFIFIGGEAAVSPNYMKAGLFHDIAKESNGAMFVCEHRYYGESKPLNVQGSDDLKYLSSRQALADLALFITKLKSADKFKNSKVVAIGGSYPGNLATWLREKYPDLVDAALASSAPILAKMDFFEYLETVGAVYKKYGTSPCHDAIDRLFHYFEESFKSQQGIENLKYRYDICEYSDLNRWENKQLFFSFMTYEYMYNAQNHGVEKIKEHCRKITNEINIFENLHLFNESYSDRKKNIGCINIDVTATNYQKNCHRSWFYQTCTEFGYYPTSSPDMPFTNNIHSEMFARRCSFAFGAQFNNATIAKAVIETNKYYGGLKPNVTKVFFTNGETDPWHRLGITKDLSEEAPAVYIPRAIHCKDLYPSMQDDSAEIIQARKTIKQTIKQWIGVDGFN